MTRQRTTFLASIALAALILSKWERRALAALNAAPFPPKFLNSPSGELSVAYANAPPMPRLVPSAAAVSTPPPTPDHYLKHLNSWHCGTDDFSKTLSLLAVGACPVEPLNWCCFEHDRCYDYYQHYIGYLRLCDEQFGYCVRFEYQNNQFCADWLYTTHVNVVRIFGEPYKQMLVNRP